VFETYAASCGRGTDNALTLTTHAIVGGAIASLMPAHPWLGLSLAFASHFLLDALPHWDYPIRSSSINPDIAARMKYDGALIADLLTIGFDAALGIVVAVTLFKAQTPTSYLLALGGACAGIFPDALQFAYMPFPHQPLTSIQRFHEWIHTTHRMSKRPLLGITSQIALVVAFILAVQPLFAAQTSQNQSPFHDKSPSQITRLSGRG